MPEMFCAAFCKCAITIIYIVIIIFMKIISYINIIPSVIINICNSQTQSIAKITLINTGLRRNICKFFCIGVFKSFLYKPVPG